MLLLKQRDRRFQSNFQPSHRLAGPRRCPRHCQKWSRRGLIDDQDEMKRLEEKSRELEREEEENRLERKRLQKELKELRKKRSAEGAAASVAEEERAKKKRADNEAALQRKAEEAEAQRKADEEEAQRIAKEEEAGRQPKNCRKQWILLMSCRRKPIRQSGRLRRQQRRLKGNQRSPAQKAKKVKKAEKAKVKAEQAKEKLMAERRAVSNSALHGNRVGMARIDFLHDKPEGWKEMWNERLAAWKAREKRRKNNRVNQG